MNDIMSFGLHRTWKQEFVKKINIKDQDVILDLATGSGDLLELIKKKVIVFVLHMIQTLK